MFASPRGDRWLLPMPSETGAGVITTSEAGRDEQRLRALARLQRQEALAFALRVRHRRGELVRGRIDGPRTLRPDWRKRRPVDAVAARAALGGRGWR